jgi:hypothetical protein
MLIAEELLLLLLDDEKGTSDAWVMAADQGLAGALLLDLLVAERLEERDGKLARAGTEPSEPALAAAWRAIDEPKPIKHWVGKLPGKLKPIKGTIAGPLVSRGVLDERRHKILGLFPSTRYAELDPSPEQELRARLRRVLVDGEEPDDRTVELLGVLVPLDMIKRLFRGGERRPANQRAKALAERGPVGDAVHAAVQQEIMGVIIATTAATAATTTASS